ncbi:MAG: hypothetical protein V2A53_03055 [bacterium]
MGYIFPLQPTIPYQEIPFLITQGVKEVILDIMEAMVVIVRGTEYILALTLSQSFITTLSQGTKKETAPKALESITMEALALFQLP